VMNQPYVKDDEDRFNQAQIHLKKIYGLRIPIDITTIYSDQPIEGINSYTSSNECDALAICARDHTFIEKLFHKSVMKTLSVTAQYPVFVFHH
jgi:hypothetical protein